MRHCSLYNIFINYNIIFVYAKAQDRQTVSHYIIKMYVGRYLMRYFPILNYSSKQNDCKTVKHVF